jgi:hypothetical protein
MRLYLISFLCLIAVFSNPGQSAAQTLTIKGVVYDTDSLSPIMYVYALNRNTDVGTMTDVRGRFDLTATVHDTLIFSYLGYEVKRVFLNRYKDSVRNNSIFIKVILIKKVQSLQQVIITSKEFTREEKQYYTAKIEEYQRFKDQGIMSPITGLYMAFSKEGKSLRKLTAMYDELLYQELLEKRLSNEKLRQVTGDEQLDCDAFRNYCRLSDDFLTLASEYDLFEVVVRKYKDFKSGKKPYRQVK